MTYPEYRERHWLLRGLRVLLSLAVGLAACVLASALFLAAAYGLYRLVKAVGS